MAGFPRLRQTPNAMITDYYPLCPRLYDLGLSSAAFSMYFGVETLSERVKGKLRHESTGSSSYILYIG